MVSKEAHRVKAALEEGPIGGDHHEAARVPLLCVMHPPAERAGERARRGADRERKGGKSERTR